MLSSNETLQPAGFSSTFGRVFPAALQNPSLHVRSRQRFIAHRLPTHYFFNAMRQGPRIYLSVLFI